MSLWERKWLGTPELPVSKFRSVQWFGGSAFADMTMFCTLNPIRPNMAACWIDAKKKKKYVWGYVPDRLDQKRRSTNSREDQPLHCWTHRMIRRYWIVLSVWSKFYFLDYHPPSIRYRTSGMESSTAIFHPLPSWMRRYLSLVIRELIAPGPLGDATRTICNRCSQCGAACHECIGQAVTTSQALQERQSFRYNHFHVFYT